MLVERNTRAKVDMKATAVCCVGIFSLLLSLHTVLASLSPVQSCESTTALTFASVPMLACFVTSVAARGPHQKKKTRQIKQRGLFM